MSYSKLLRELLEHHLEDGTITRDLFDALWMQDPIVPTMYLLPKVHKHPRTHPGRPIIAGNAAFMENIGKFIDCKLEHIVESLPSFVKDTKDLLKKIDSIQLEEDMLLVGLDIESLYTNIRHQDGLEATSFFL